MNTNTESDKVSDQEIADLKAQAAADLAAPTESLAERKSRERAEKKAASAPKPKYVAPVNADSIRQQVRSRLLAGETTAQITAYLAENKPGTAAAAKSTIHIAYYRSKLRKEGLLPKVGAAAAQA